MFSYLKTIIQTLDIKTPNPYKTSVGDRHIDYLRLDRSNIHSLQGHARARPARIQT